MVNLPRTARQSGRWKAIVVRLTKHRGAMEEGKTWRLLNDSFTLRSTTMTRLLHLLTNLFPVWVVLGGIIALIQPPLFAWFSNEWITWGLAVIMLGMGITLSVDDFKAARRRRRVCRAIPHHAVSRLG